MKTFHIEIENLGPIRSAKFDASHFNVICGKNNSGKSFLLHTLYCLFSYGRYALDLEVYQPQIDLMLSSSKVDVDFSVYLDGLNARIAAAMPTFIQQLPSLLCKQISGLSRVSIKVEADLTYIKEHFKAFNYNFNFDISQNSYFHIEKPSGSMSASLTLASRTNETPPAAVTVSGLRSALALVCHSVIPLPLLITAERAGSVMYGDDVQVYNFRLQQESTPGSSVATHRYPFALLQELQFLQNIKKGVFESHSNTVPEHIASIHNLFVGKVADGEFHARNGVLYYKQNSETVPEINVEEASTSIKALAELDYFIRVQMGPTTMLMVDEPELNLHPERQRALTRILARIVKKGGSGVAISTHSPIIIRELNTLIAMGSNQELYQQEMTEFGYSEAEVLANDHVACGVAENGSITTMPVEKSSGFFIESFDDASEEISRVQNALVKKW